MILRTSRRRSAGARSFDTGSSLRTGLIQSNERLTQGYWAPSILREPVTLDFEDNMQREASPGASFVGATAGTQPVMRKPWKYRRMSTEAVGTDHDLLDTAPPIGLLQQGNFSTPEQRAMGGLYPVEARQYGRSLYFDGGVTNGANSAEGLNPQNWMSLADWEQTSTTQFTMFFILQPEENGEVSRWRSVLTHAGGIRVDVNTNTNQIRFDVGTSGVYLTVSMSSTLGAKPSVFCFSHTTSAFFSLSSIHENGILSGKRAMNYSVAPATDTICNFGASSNRKDLTSFRGNLYYFEYWPNLSLFPSLLPDTDNIARHSARLMEQYARRPFWMRESLGPIDGTPSVEPRIAGSASIEGRIAGISSAEARVVGAASSEGRISGTPSAEPRIAGEPSSE